MEYSEVVPPADDGGLPPTAEYIAYHAALHPSDTALIEEGSRVSYEEFHRDLNRVRAAARELGLKAGDSVAVEWNSFYRHWLFLLAFETLGVATTTYTRQEIDEYHRLLASVDFLVGNGGAVPAGPARIIDQTKWWPDEILACEPTAFEPIQRIHPQTALRIHCSSGTTGKPKQIVRTAAVHEFRVRQYLEKEGYDRRSRYLLSHGFSVHAVYGRATACLRMGGTCILRNGPLIDSLTDFEATHVALLPGVLENMMEFLPRDFLKPRNLTVSTFGGSVPRGLRENALDRLATDFIESYGTNETGTICTIDEEGTGIVVPNVRVEVVDDDDRPLIGASGRIRVSSAGTISAYRNDPESTARMFRDGWFYPGDSGIMAASRSLKLLGRTDDLINLGGIKVDPEPIERKLRQIPAVDDAGIVALSEANGKVRLWVALVLESPANLRETGEIAMPDLPAIADTISFIAADHIPRTLTGKIRRNMLADLISDERNTFPSDN